MTIWWDMDGTIADLYGVDGWLDMLLARETTPYENAKVMWNMSYLARLMNKAQKAGCKLGIISWTAKNAPEAYCDEIATAKLNWLRRHLASVRFDEIEIVGYGVPKYQFKHSDDDILFDDEAPNRKAWHGQAFTPDKMVEILKEIGR